MMPFYAPSLVFEFNTHRHSLYKFARDVDVSHDGRTATTGGSTRHAQAFAMVYMLRYVMHTMRLRLKVLATYNNHCE